MLPSPRIATRAVGLALALTWLFCVSAGAADWTLVGTTVDADGRTPAANVRVTLHPGGAVNLSDEDGDFVLSWNGARGWLTLVPPDTAGGGQAWCKRIVLAPPAASRSDGLHDVGVIRVTTRARLTYQTVPGMPRGMRRPASLRLEGPGAGEPDTCGFRFRYKVDLWGGLVSLEQTWGDERPAALRDTVERWLRDIVWVVPAETTCEGEAPFAGEDEVWYAWADTAWVQAQGLELQKLRRARMPGPAAGAKK